MAFLESKLQPIDLLAAYGMAMRNRPQQMLPQNAPMPKYQNPFAGMASGVGANPDFTAIPDPNHPQDVMVFNRRTGQPVSQGVGQKISAAELMGGGGSKVMADNLRMMGMLFGGLYGPGNTGK